jgi:hypothetical protein
MKQFLDTMQVKHPQLLVRDYEVYFDGENARLFERVADASHFNRPSAVTTKSPAIAALPPPVGWKLIVAYISSQYRGGTQSPRTECQFRQRC